MRKSTNVFGIVMTIMAAFMLFFVVGTIAYNEYNTSEVTVVVKLKPGEDPFVTLRTLCQNEATVTEVREIDKIGNEYQVRISTKKPMKRIIEMLKKNEKVEKVEVKEH